MKYSLFVFFALLWFSITTMAIEQRPYSVIQKEGAIEIRSYQRIVSAEVVTFGNRNEAASDAFRILFRFIQGRNDDQLSIAMTAPVSQNKHENDGWAVRFYMPAAMSMSDVPTPEDPRITLIENTQVNLAAIRFSGFNSAKNLAKNEKKLREYLEKNEFEYIDQPTYAFYNAPYVPPFLKRNEVLFEIKGKK